MVGWMMAVMTAQPPLPLMPTGAPVGAAAAIIEDDDGGRVFVHGNLAYAWDAGDTAGRRFAAVSLMRIKAATQLQVAEAFAVPRARCGAGRPALRRRGGRAAPGPQGPKRKSKLTADTVAAIAVLREEGRPPRDRRRAGVSEGSVRNALSDADDRR